MAGLKVSVPATVGPGIPYYVGTLKGLGRIYQQTSITTSSKVACAKLYDSKTPGHRGGSAQ